MDVVLNPQDLGDDGEAEGRVGEEHAEARTDVALDEREGALASPCHESAPYATHSVLVKDLL